MYLKIPFEKEIEFNTNISEITKISLEHDYNVGADEILGNFYITGEYRIHSVSINREEFKYTLPFSLSLDQNIDRSTILFNIEDFNYEILNNNVLKVYIEYSLKGEENTVFVKPEEELEIMNEIEDEILEREEKEETIIMDALKESTDTFVTYHIHIVKENETYESISALYNMPLSMLKDYNNEESLNVGDKVLIPEFNE